MADVIQRPISKALSGKGLALVILAYCLIAIWLFSDTVTSMVHTWSVNDTFAHGFVILPISLWLVWNQREYLAGASASPQFWPLLLTLGGGLAWFIASIVDVRVVQQFAFVGILVTGIWSILGSRLAKQLSFPLAFLFLAVPMGAGLIPPLIELTTDSTEALVRGSGVPVYREGNYLMLPSGNWSVVEACSGIRYLIASFTLGLVYAWLTYNSIWRRTVFVVASIAVPIVANSLRAYGIVMIGHLSDMELATGVDHLIYGWVFFGAVMLLLFWVGSFWQEPELPKREPASSKTKVSNSVSAATILTVVIVTAFGPTLSVSMQSAQVERSYSALQKPSPAAGWRTVETPDTGWAPNQAGADRELDVYFTDGAGPWTGLLLRQYLHQAQGIELVQAERPWRADADQWRVLAEQRLDPELSSIEGVVEAKLAHGSKRLLVWTWYRVGGRYTTNPYLVKIWEAWQQLTIGEAVGTRMFALTPIDDSQETARLRLSGFVGQHLNRVEVILDARSGTAETAEAGVGE